MSKKLAWITTSLVLAAGCAGVAGYATHGQNLAGNIRVAPGYAFAQPTPVVHPIQPAAIPGNPDDADLKARIDALVNNPALGDAGVVVLDSTDGGRLVYDHKGDTALTPASVTKVLTSAAAMSVLGPTDRIRTAILPGPGPEEITIKAAGDVWMDPSELARAADAIKQARTEPITQVTIDVGIWQGPELQEGWDARDIDAGFVAPMQPAMMHSARIGADSGDVPRSHTPAYDVAATLAAELGGSPAVRTVTSTDEDTLANPPLYVLSSPPLSERLRTMMEDSDNVMAEAIGRELALASGYSGDFNGTTAAVTGQLTHLGIDLSGVTLVDGSGLSLKNRIPPQVLARIMDMAVHNPEVRPILEVLPVAGGTGTLRSRYGDLEGKGLVRAKTGTLTDTSGLAGVVSSPEGRVYSFGMIANHADVLGQRRVLDLIANTLVQPRSQSTSAGN